MGKITSAPLAISLVVLVLLVGYGAARVFASWQRHYLWAEMDWNSDGSTSISEFLQSSDVGKRLVSVAGNECVEYFSLKDGLAVKVMCSSVGRELPSQLKP